jgi:tryptophan synthase alpha chain
MQTQENGPQVGSPAPGLRVRAAFATARQANRGALIPYFMCGYPSGPQSIAAVLAAAEAGADIIELGLPFSDPLADGPTIQHAGRQALQGGMTMHGCLEIARQVSAHSRVPLLLMGHYNPLLAYGLERFCQDAAASGVCGLIIPDLPPEEAGPLRQAALDAGLTLIFLVPPTTSNERIAALARLASAIAGSFLYCVSLSGVTGVREELPTHLPAFLARVTEHTHAYGLPIAVGFGLSKPAHIATVVRLADGAAVGSALVKLLAEHPEAPAEAVKNYVSTLVAATERAHTYI